MYIYKIGYYSYDDSYYFELGHQEKFTEDQLTDLIAEAVYEIVKKRTKDVDPDYPKDILEDFIVEWRGDDGGIENYLVVNKGFQKIQYEAVWSCAGHCSVILDNVSDDGVVHPELDKIKCYLKSKGLSIKDF